MRPVGIAFLGLTVLLLMSLRDDLGWGRIDPHLPPLNLSS